MYYGIFTWMVDFYGVHVGKYIPVPWDGMGCWLIFSAIFGGTPLLKPPFGGFLNRRELVVVNGWAGCVLDVFYSNKNWVNQPINLIFLYFPDDLMFEVGLTWTSRLTQASLKLRPGPDPTKLNPTGSAQRSLRNWFFSWQEKIWNHLETTGL